MLASVVTPTFAPDENLNCAETFDIFVKPRVKVENDSKDPEVYVGDQNVLERLQALISGIQEGKFDEETKQAIYYYAENFIDNSNTSEYVKQVNEATKYFVTGWWFHNLVEKTDDSN